MILRTSLDLSTLMLALLGFVALVMAGTLPIGLIIVGSTALGLGGVSIWRGTAPATRVLGPRGWNTALLVIVFVFGLDLLLISRDLLSASLHFLVLLMSCQVLHLKQGKDCLHLAAISFMALVGSAAFATAVWFGAIAMLYMVGAVWMLLLFHFWSEADGSDAVRTLLKNHLPESRLFWWTNAMAVMALCVTMMMFFTIPRVGAGFFQKTRTNAIHVSGFSTSVEPGDLKPVTQDSTIVMRVRFPDDPKSFDPKNETLYMRGMAYDHFDGRRWSNRFDPEGAARRGGEFQVLPSEGGESVQQEVVLEPIDTRILFGIPSVAAVQGPFDTLAADAAGVLYMQHPPYTQLSYTVRSLQRRAVPAERGRTDLTYPTELTRTYGQLPDLDPQVETLAQTITADATTPYEAVQAIERYLETNYAYSLETAADAGPRSPLEAFLFTWKTGYCEHFATAMTVLVRAVGIPARLVTGFLEGEWNEFGQYHALRQRDAHAWTEVYFPQFGWVTVDATPAVNKVAPSPWTTIVRMADWVRFSWNRYIVEYSFQDQLAMAREVQAWTARIKSMGRSFVVSLEQWAGRFQREVVLVVQAHSPGQLAVEVFAVGVAIGGMGLLIRRVLNTRPPFMWRGRNQGLGNGKGRRIYQRMLMHLASQGIAKDPHATPWEFHARVSKEWREIEPLVRSVTAWYCRIRYGGTSATASEIARAESWVRRVRAARR